VLYLAGENPDDHRMRFILLCDELKLDPTALNILWLPFRADLSGKPFKKALEDQDAAHGPFGLIIADTSQAYFQGKDENDNPQMLEHAKMFRDLIALLPSRPAVVVSCHPTKNGDKLVPRGGSSFFNEIDTNLCVDKREHTTVANLHWVEKIRGVDFPPLPFELRTGQTEHLKDAKGRKIWSIVAVPISEATATGLEETNEARAMQVLSLLVEDVGMSLTAIAERLDWSYPNGEPNKSLVQRLVNSLADQRMIEKGPPRRVMPKGQRAVAGYTPPAPAPANRGRPGDDWW
jgi:hypothetical protein